jgi:uncharacterized protein YeaO (DUF488 family)
MTQIKTKRVYEIYSEEDGIRILVDKLWPRGIKKEDLKYDIWEKDIVPSDSLRKRFHEDKINNWDKFKSQYHQELLDSESVKTFIERIRQYPMVTLLYAAKDAERNHILILKPFLEHKLR